MKIEFIWIIIIIIIIIIIMSRDEGSRPIPETFK